MTAHDFRRTPFASRLLRHAMRDRARRETGSPTSSRSSMFDHRREGIHGRVRHRTAGRSTRRRLAAGTAGFSYWTNGTASVHRRGSAALHFRWTTSLDGSAADMYVPRYAESVVDEQAAMYWAELQLKPRMLACRVAATARAAHIALARQPCRQRAVTFLLNDRYPTKSVAAQASCSSPPPGQLSCFCSCASDVRCAKSRQMFPVSYQRH